MKKLISAVASADKEDKNTLATALIIISIAMIAAIVVLAN